MFCLAFIGLKKGILRTWKGFSSPGMLSLTVLRWLKKGEERLFSRKAITVSMPLPVASIALGSSSGVGFLDLDAATRKARCVLKAASTNFPMAATSSPGVLCL